MNYTMNLHAKIGNADAIAHDLVMQTIIVIVPSPLFHVNPH